MRLFDHEIVLQEAFLVEPKSQKEALVGEKGDNSEVPLTKVMFFTSIFFSVWYRYPTFFLVISVFIFIFDSALQKIRQVFKTYKSFLSSLNPLLIFFSH
jgi:hypothetical protein